MVFDIPAFWLAVMACLLAGGICWSYKILNNIAAGFFKVIGYSLALFADFRDLLLGANKHLAVATKDPVVASPAAPAALTVGLQRGEAKKKDDYSKFGDIETPAYMRRNKIPGCNRRSSKRQNKRNKK